MVLNFLRQLSVPMSVPESTPIRIYVYDGCETCRKALKWLDAHHVKREEIPIRQVPPTVPELRRMLGITGELRKLFNTSGLDYKAMGMKSRLQNLKPEEAFNLLSANGNLVKRPFLLTPAGGAVGFKEDEWRKVLGV